MSGAAPRTIRQLFKDWRSGDADAGQTMAQRVADWYYAIATSRLGEQRGREPCDRACASFGSGVIDITESRRLEPWAHGLILKELEQAGHRERDGDEPSLYTRDQRPKGLLVRARSSLPAEIALLEAVYGSHEDRSRIDELAAPLGGNPLGILEARYRVKRWLRDQAGVRLDVVPDKPNLDRAPLPLYEADRMANRQEENQFELWMLTDLDLCKDIAEFAHFSIALRGGLPDVDAPSKATPATSLPPAVKPRPASPPSHPPQPAASRGPGLWMILGGAVLVIAIAGAVLFGAVTLFFSMG